MRLKKIQLNLEKFDIFSWLCLPILALGWLGVALALAGVFYVPIWYGAILLVCLFWASIIFSQRKRIKIGLELILVLIISLLAIIIFAYFTTPTIFSGRDQGSLSLAAIQLVQNHQIATSFPAEKEFFNIYGPGKALNFPGFNYAKNGELISQFPIGYVSWLAIFYSLLNLQGLVVANALTFLIFLLAFYFLGKKYLKNYSALFLILTVVTSFVFSWFFKFTLSENLALMLVWLGIYEFILFLEKEERFYLMMTFLSFGLLLFSRIEALLFLAVIGLIIFYKYRGRLKKIIGKNILWLMLAIGILYVVNIIICYPFYTILAKSVVKLFMGTSANNAASFGALGFLAETINVFKIFLVYAILPYLFLAILAVIYFWRKKNYTLLIPLLIVAPTFFYILSPNISGDHPWMLRRFLFSVIPACIFYTILLLDRFFQKKIIFYFLTALLIVANLFVFSLFINFSPHQGLFEQMKTLSLNFQNSDLVLIDQRATGDGWSMLPDPMQVLEGKQAVYFFNSQDLEKIDKSKFSAVYLVIPDSNLDFYQKNGMLGKLKLVKEYQLTNEILGADAEESISAMALPLKQKLVTNGGIYLLGN